MPRSVMQHTFDQIPRADIQRSAFNRSHGYKTTFDVDYLVPIYVDEVLPGDTFNLHLNAFCRMATPTKPLLDNLFLETFFFFVPNRLLWDNWQKFCGERTDPVDDYDNDTDYLVPQVTTPNYGAGGVAVGSLFDYFGIPTGPLGAASVGLKVNNWHGRAYNLIWREFFRDQNLQDSPVVDTDDGPDTYTDYVLRKRCKRPDYFTTALPWTQKGPDVLLPLGSQAPVRGIGKGTQVFSSTDVNVWETDNAGGLTTPTTYDFRQQINAGAADETFYVEGSGNPGLPMIYADLAAATAATIPQLRAAFQLQKLFERDARGGTRYTEILKSHFGVTSPDFRLQRPEYLGGGSSLINVHPIAQTANTPATGTPQGNLAAFATGSVNGHGFVKSFVEHGVLVGLVNVRADITYQQGLNKMWSRRTRYDYSWPVLTNLSEQAVLQREIFASGVVAEDELVFGYQEKDAEYRHKPSLITGKFRSTYATTLDVWHLSQEFANAPTLSDTFIESNTPMGRVLAIDTEPHFLLDAYFNLTTVRPMPVYSVPGLIDHF